MKILEKSDAVSYTLVSNQKFPFEKMVWPNTEY